MRKILLRIVLLRILSKKIVIGLGFVFALGFSACDEDMVHSEALNTQWHLYILSQNGEFFELSNPNETKILIKENEFSGNLGCNKVFGVYKISRNKILFENVGVTKKLCDPKSMKVEDALLHFFSNGGAQITLKNDELVLEKDSLTAVFRKRI